jgi:hypothetical protein
MIRFGQLRRCVDKITILAFIHGSYLLGRLAIASLLIRMWVANHI